MGGETWQMVPWDPGLGLAATGKHKHRRTRTVALVALSLLAGFACASCQRLGIPLLLPSLKTGQVELRGLGPQSRSHPVTFEIIIIIYDLEKIILSV